MARTKTNYASNSGTGKTLGAWGHSARHAEERLTIDDYTAFVGDAVSGGVNTPDVNLAMRGRGSLGSSWDHPQGYWLANKSGATRGAGDVVVVDAGNDDAYTTTVIPDNPLVCGVVEASTANNASGPVITGGRIVSVSVTAATRGQYLTTSATAGKAQGNAAPSRGTFAVALQDASGGFCKALLLPALSRALDVANAAYNGAMGVWQRGTGSRTHATTYNTDTSFGPDRWFCLPGGASVTSQQSTSVPTNGLSAYSWQITGATSVTTVDLGQRYEAAYTGRNLRGQQVFSAWVYNGTGASITPNLRIGTPGAADNFTTVTNRLDQALQACPDATWTQVYFSFQADAYTNFANGLEVALRIASGVLVATKLVRITQVRIEPGIYPTLTRFPDDVIEKLRCQRFAMRLNNTSGTYTSIGMGAAWAATDATVGISIPVELRASPTMTWSANGDFIVLGPTHGAIAMTGNAFYSMTAHNLQVLPTVASGLTAGHATGLYFGPGSGWITFSAEL